MSTLAVRPALPQDEIFLYELYSAVRGPEFALAPIPAQQKEDLIRMQFRASMSAYAQMYPNSCCHVVLLDSKPVGRLWFAPGEGEFHLVDIAVHPELQSKGIGSVLIKRLQQFNPGSVRFHQRNGFTIIREDQVNYYMEWRPVLLF